MSAPGLTAAAPVDAWRGLRLAVFPIGLGLLLLGIAFHAEITAAVGVWLASTAYNHCLLVIPIAAYLAWDRRATVAGLMPQPLPWLAVVGLPLAVAWLVAERLGIMEGRQLIAMAFVELLFLGVLGWRLFGRLSAPLLYLFFLVPFGGFLTPMLQSFTAHFVTAGLNLFGIPNFSDGNTIEIPEGIFYIAQACAGLRFLIASIAFGVLYACLIYRSPMRRLMFIAVAIVTPIIANGLRALGIVTLGHVLGSAQAAATDHVLYGWIFFSLVLLLLVVLGLPFRQDLAPSRSAPAPSGGPPAWAGVVGAAVAVVVVAAAGPATAALLDQATTVTPLSRPIAFQAGGDCRADAIKTALADDGDGQSAVSAWRISCGEENLVLRLERFAPRINPGVVLAEQRRLSAPLSAEDVESSWLTVPGWPAHSWQLVETSGPFQATAVMLWANGAPAAGGIDTRLHLAWNSVAGTRQAPLLLALGLETDGQKAGLAQQAAAREALSAFLRTQPSLLELVQRVSSSAADAVR